MTMPSALRAAFWIVPIVGAALFSVEASSAPLLARRSQFKRPLATRGSRPWWRPRRFRTCGTVASERAPWVLTDGIVARSFLVAEQQGRFEVDAVSPERAARHVLAPVLLIHGTDDRETSASHSKRVMAALAGPKRLILVEGAGHNRSLRQETVWTEIDGWIEEVVRSRSF
jgi:pimeloyl-ACP methyl ester carboxylesterase